MSWKVQGFVLFLPPHTFFQASVLSVQPILFFGQSGIFLAQIFFLVTGFLYYLSYFCKKIDILWISSR